MNSATETNTEWPAVGHPIADALPLVDQCVDYLRQRLPTLLVLTCVLGILATIV